MMEPTNRQKTTSLTNIIPSDTLKRYIYSYTDNEMSTAEEYKDSIIPNIRNLIRSRWTFSNDNTIKIVTKEVKAIDKDAEPLSDVKLFTYTKDNYGIWSLIAGDYVKTYTTIISTDKPFSIFKNNKDITSTFPLGTILKQCNDNIVYAIHNEEIINKFILSKYKLISWDYVNSLLYIIDLNDSEENHIIKFKQLSSDQITSEFEFSTIHPEFSYVCLEYDSDATYIEYDNDMHNMPVRYKGKLVDNDREDYYTSTIFTINHPYIFRNDDDWDYPIGSTWVKDKININIEADPKLTFISRYIYVKN